jgi:hypothetical protein
LLASVTVTVYVPAASPVFEEVNPPFDHWYIYAGVPPDVDIDAAPVLNPLHATFVEVGVVVIAVGCVIVNDRADVHEFASVMVQV